MRDRRVRVITGAHPIIYSADPDGVRAFFSDVLELTRPIAEERWGLVTAIRLPGGGELGLYEPRHPIPPH